MQKRTHLILFQDVILQYVYLKTVTSYDLKKILLHTAIVLNENLDWIKAEGDKGQRFALKFNDFKKSPLLVLGFSVFLSLASVL